LMHLEAVRAQGERYDSQRLADELDRTARLLRESVSEARRIISGLRPPVLDELGIVAAIEYLVNEACDAVDVTFTSDTQFERFAAPLENAIFRIVQEALNNVVRHSKAQKARVELAQLPNCLRLTVQDWGVGFDPQETVSDRFG